jgi:hypothetical protein
MTEKDLLRSSGVNFTTFLSMDCAFTISLNCGEELSLLVYAIAKIFFLKILKISWPQS